MAKSPDVDEAGAVKTEPVPPNATEVALAKRKADEEKAASDKAAAEEQAKVDAQTVDVIATGSFHELANFQGRLLQAGDAFSTERARAVELRAAGLVRYADDKAEKEAAVDDAPPSMDGDQAVITTRSVRRRTLR